MTRWTRSLVMAAAIAAVSIAIPGAASAAKKKEAMKPACTAGSLCAAPCNDGKLCNIQVCMAGGKTAATLGFCREGSPFCPPKC